MWENGQELRPLNAQQIKNNQTRAALGPITGSPRHSFSRENEKLMDRGWSGDGVGRMSENVSGAGPNGGYRERKKNGNVVRTRK